MLKTSENYGGHCQKNSNKGIEIMRIIAKVLKLVKTTMKIKNKDRQCKRPESETS